MRTYAHEPVVGCRHGFLRKNNRSFSALRLGKYTSLRFISYICPTHQNRIIHMRTVIQRVAHASVTIHGERKAAIGRGMLILVGIEEADGQEDIDWLAKKIVNLRIFDDEQGVMNRSLLETGGEILVVSQFTLHASVKKGNRPSYIKAARPETAIPIYEAFCQALRTASGKDIGTGTFGADMKVELLNDGPVTICIDSKLKE